MLVYIMGYCKIICMKDIKNKLTESETMNKGILLINLVSSETLISPNFLMEDKNFVKKAKKLIKDKIEFYTVKDKLVKWCNTNY